MNWLEFIDNLLKPREIEERSPAVSTVVSVIYTTAPKTFDGPAIYVTAGAPLIQSRTTVTARPTTTSTKDNDDDDEKPTTTSLRSLARATSVSSVAVDTSSLSSKISVASITSATVVPSLTSLATTTFTSPTPLTRASSSSSRSSVSSAAASATAESTTRTGMSGGSIAGLIFGIILGLGLLIGAILWFNKRQKRKLDSARLDDEKSMATRPNAPPFNPSVGPFPTAPRISLRPGSQFSPNFGSNSGASNYAPAAAGAIATTATFPIASQPKSAPQQSMSAWERPGASSANNDPANPFGNHAETLNNSPPRSAPLAMPEPSVPNVNAADFPLPASGTSTPTPMLPDVGLAAAGTPVGTAISEPSNASTPSLVSTGEAAAAGIAAGAIAGGAAAAVAAKNGPQSPSKPAESKVHRVQMDFHPSMDDELAIRSGQLVKVQHEYDDGWALVAYMDGSRSGVVPRTCLSKHSLQPRPKNGPPPMNGRPGPNGPGMRGPPGQGRPMSPAGARGPGPRSQSPYGRNSPGPYGGPNGRPQSPYGNPGPRSQSPYGPGPRSGSPANMGGRARAGSSASAGGHAYNNSYGPGQGRSMSPGPYGAGGLRPTPRPDNMRRRSNSMGQIDSRRMMQQQQQQGFSGGQMPSRKPVGGME